MKTCKFFVVLLAFLSLSSMVWSQTAITIQEGETLRVKCWSDGNGSQNLSLDIDCNVNLNGDEYGNNADTIVVVGTYFYMEMGNEDAQYLFYDWSDFSSGYTHMITPNGQSITEWMGDKYSTSTGHDYWGIFWVRFVEPVTTYSVSFNVHSSGTPISGAVVTCNSSDVSTDLSGVAVFSELEAGSYPYSVSANGYVLTEGSVSLTNSDITEWVNLTPLGMTQVFADAISYRAYDLSGRELGMGTMSELVSAFPTRGVFLLVGGGKTIKVVK